VQKVERIVRALLGWFPRHARDLPWRRTTDPYAIWISEVMLQQTQVKTVIPYWERWMKELPSVESLADARLDRVYKLWEGLGYYTRARYLHRAAQQIVRQDGGIVPAELAKLRALPGVGRYTAGAICSIAFDQPAPVLDGNVIRVLTRLFSIEGNPRESATNAELWELAESFVKTAAAHRSPKLRACSAINQALMELGATICTPPKPDCLRCPVRRSCNARRENRIRDFPRTIARAKAVPRHFAAFVVRHGSRFLVRKRPANVVNGGLWEFPNVEVSNSEFHPGKAARTCLGLTLTHLKHLCVVKHSITRYRMSLHVFIGTITNSPTPSASVGSWRTLHELKALAFPGAHARILAELSTRRKSQ